MKSTMIKTLLTLSLLLAMSAAAFGTSVTYRVSLDTSSLIGHAAAPFFLSFQFSDGAGTGNGNNTATLSGFNFGTGGSATGAPVLQGGASGSVASSVNLIDSAFLNLFTQRFVPGSTLSFLLSLTTTVEPGGTPDEFSFALLDNSGFELPYNSPFDAALVIDIANPLTIQTFATNGVQPPAGGGAAIKMAAPSVTAVPEPATLPLAAIGIAALVASCARRSRINPLRLT